MNGKILYSTLASQITILSPTWRFSLPSREDSSMLDFFTSIIATYNWDSNSNQDYQSGNS